MLSRLFLMNVSIGCVANSHGLNMPLAARTLVRMRRRALVSVPCVTNRMPPARICSSVIGTASGMPCFFRYAARRFMPSLTLLAGG